MALNSGFANLNAVSDTFGDWLNKTNEIIRLMREDVVTANTAGAETSGDAILIGSFYANNLVAADSLSGGTYSATANLSITSNLHVTNSALDTIVWKNFEVASNTHLGATTSATHTLQVTGDVLVSGESTFQSIVNIGDPILPITTGEQIGNTTHRFDAFLIDVDVSGGIVPTSNTLSLGAVSGRWNLFANTIDASGDIEVLGDVEIGETLTVQSTTLMNGVLTVNADAVFVSNVSVANLEVTGTANVNILRVIDVYGNNFGIIAGSSQPTVDSTTADIVIDTVAASESNGFKYVIEGRNTNANSCYFVEISVAHNNSDVFFTRYGEVGNNFNAEWDVGINGSNIELKVTCSGAAPVSNVHSFNIVKYQTR